MVDVVKVYADVAYTLHPNDVDGTFILLASSAKDILQQAIRQREAGFVPLLSGRDRFHPCCRGVTVSTPVVGARPFPPLLSGRDHFHPCCQARPFPPLLSVSEMMKVLTL
jgi:hypothetical protein